MSLFTKALGLDPIQSSLRKNQAASLSSLGTQIPTLQQNATAAGAGVRQFQPQRNTAGQGLLDLLNRGYDGQGTKKAQILKRTGAGYDAAIGNARINASRTGSDPTASIALLDARRAGDTTNALTDYEAQKQAMDLQYKQNALGVAQGLTGSALGEQNDALGALRGIYGTQFQGYGNLAEQEEQAKAAAYQRLTGLIGTGASLIGGGAVAPRSTVMSGGRGVGGATFSMPEPVVSNAGMGGGNVLDIIRRQNAQKQLYSGGY